MTIGRRIVCDGECGKCFEEDSESYFTIVGNILLGKNGSLIAGNTKDVRDGTGIVVVRIVHYCKECFVDILEL
jgi:hypothetical protein